MKKLEDLTELEYKVLNSVGQLFKVYPQATGDYDNDCNKSNGSTFDKVQKNDIGQ